MDIYPGANGRMSDAFSILGHGTAPTMTSPAPSLQRLRRRIDMLDGRLIRLLNQRAAQAITIGGIKLRQGLPAIAPRREREVLQNALRANQGPLATAAVRRLMRLVIAECRATERAHMRRQTRKMKR